MGEVVFEELGDESECVAVLRSTGLDHRKHGLDEAAARSTLGAEGQLAPDHRVTQGAFTRIVRWFDAVVIQKRPHPFAVVQQFLAEARCLGVRAPQAAQQQAFDRATSLTQRRLQSSLRDGAVAAARPLTKHVLRVSQQLPTEVPGDAHAALGQSLEVPFEMGPVPLIRSTFRRLNPRSSHRSPENDRAMQSLPVSIEARSLT